MDKQRDFEKGWEEYKAKRKQEIEELGQDIYDNCPDLCENGCGGKPCYKCIAEALHRDNYRKIPENTVVLTREEWDKYQETQRDWNAIYFEGIDKTRKETAEKFAERVKEEAFAVFMGEPIIRASKIDEICKEFTEGKV